jgi:hypothetical protein
MAQNNQNFFPRCLNNTRFISYTAEGCLTPCCWVDGDPDFDKFYDKSLYIDNNESIEDIFNSRTWQEFYHMLENKPELAPHVCKRQCTEVKTNPNRDRITISERKNLPGAVLNEKF